MKKYLLSLLAVCLSSPALALVQIPISEVFIPGGYDDNDNVEVVVDGVLPNACYQLAHTQVYQSGNTFQLIQYAEVRTVADCKNQDSLPSKLDWPTSYSAVVNLGVLSAGRYDVAYAQSKTGGLELESLQVVTATTNEVDDKTYAPISRAFVPEVIYQTNNVQVVLSGVLGTLCLEVDQNIEIRRNDNVIVILPTLKERPGLECSRSSRPIEIVQSLGNLAPGRYLLHVRSTVGKAVNRTFTVIEPPTDPRKRD